MKKGKRGQVALVIVFLFLAFIIVLLGATISPMGARLTNESFTAGDMLLTRAELGINDIQDTVVKTELITIVGAASDSRATNDDIISQIFNYSWLIILILTAVVIYIRTKMLVDFKESRGFT